MSVFNPTVDRRVRKMLGPAIWALKRDQFFWGRVFFGLIGIAPGYCFYNICREINEMKLHSKVPHAPDSPEWLGTMEGRKQRLTIIGILIVAMVSLVAGCIFVNQ